MKVDITARNALMNDIRTFIRNVPANVNGNWVINFYSATNTLLCAVEFNDLITPTDISSDIAAWQFVNTNNDGMVLQNPVSASTADNVSYFTIAGKIGVSPIINNMFQGTVGQMGSLTADITFNRLLWDNQTTVTIDSLIIEIPNGA